MAKRVIYTDKAFDDIDRIVEFNNKRNNSTTYSKKFLSALKKQLVKLSKQPYSGMKTDEPGAYLAVWDSYYMFYSPGENSIEIAAIYHQKENVIR